MNGQKNFISFLILFFEQKNCITKKRTFEKSFLVTNKDNATEKCICILQKIRILITVIQSDYVISNARMFSRLLAQVSNRMFSTYHFGVSKFCIRSGARFNKKRNAGFRNHFPYENKNNLEFLGMFGSLATTVSSFMF